MVTLKIPAHEVRGFNYHPSYSTGAMEDWLLFDEEVWTRELTRGKELFPKINAIRLWLSWNAYCRLQGEFIKRVRKAVEICKGLGLYVIPCLFNRWHDPMVDCDGIYIDHFLPGSSWILKFGDPFTDYVDALAKEFGKEEGILVWDICNEPLAYNANYFPLRDLIQPHEINWLRTMTENLRRGVTQPIGVGSTGGYSMKLFEGMFDVHLTHMYYTGDDIGEFEKTVKKFVKEAEEDDCPLICSECCWGALDDKKRADMMRVTLDTFKKYKVGFVAHALWYSGCADLHDPCDGRVTDNIGNLAFISKDGNMRPYHEIINEY